MKPALLVFLGGGIGSVMRYALGKWIGPMTNHSFPLATLFINILACLLLGFVVGLADHKQVISPASRLFWTVGICGGFSTFSTFSNETLLLMQNGFTTSLILYVILSVVLCLVATFGGIYLSGRI